VSQAQTLSISAGQELKSFSRPIFVIMDPGLSKLRLRTATRSCSFLSSKLCFLCAQPRKLAPSSYRLASLGFLAGNALANEGSLNLGVRDQRLALHWVQENIAKFGGNPECVTFHSKSHRDNNRRPLQEGDDPRRKVLFFHPVGVLPN
jgi:hypothetical protein